MDRLPYDVIVIGGSFAGLSAAMQLARARRRVLVIDAGRPRNRFSHAAHGFLGQDGRAPAAILDEARAQLLAYPTADLVAGEAEHARQSDEGFAVTLASGERVAASRLIIATGVVDELPDLPGVRERWGVTVLHCPYCHGYEVAGGQLGVLATDDMAIHQALLIPDWGEVTLFTNGLPAPDAAQMAQLRARGVRVETEPVAAVVGKTPALDAIKLRDGRILPLDALFVASRTRLASPLAAQLGCACDEGPFGPIIRTDPTKETTVPGVFAAGDAARVPHNITFASADGVMAGLAAHRALISSQ